MNYIAIIPYQKCSVGWFRIDSAGVRIADEDTLCAEFIKNALENKTNDFSKIIKHLREYRSAHKFFDPTKDWAPERDFDLCLSLNKFNFVLKVEPYNKNQYSLRKLKSRAALN